ncbi:MAG: lysophospholipase [Eubacterium sp.]|nr:lysophospholipase [Eubacterium sp.]
MRNEFYYRSIDGEHKIHAVEWGPKDEPRAVLQLIHGMTEYIGRYDEFASFMADNGFCVVGNDHLGHGDSVDSSDDYGYFREKNGNRCLLEDIRTLRDMTREKYPEVPYFILGHSMGSFLARQFMARYGEGLSGAVIMGTGSQGALALDSGMMLCRAIAAIRGWRYRSKLVRNMASGNYNKRFGNETPAEWLSKNTENKKAYLSNKKCTFIFTVNGYYNLFYSFKDCQDRKTVEMIRKDLPVLLVSGAEDPVGNYGEGVKQAFKLYKDAGLQDIEMKLYEGDRHEILNELDRDKVYHDLLSWFEEKMPQETEEA